MKKYDVAIIGAGTAGLSARREVAKETTNYIVIDPGPLGTTCARVGCMPSKVLIEVANLFYSRNKFSQVGISGGEQLALDQKAMMKHVRTLRDRFVRSVLQDIELWTSTHLVAKRARFIDEKTLDLEGERIQAEAVVIATGSSPVIPKPWHAFKKFLFDTDAFFERKDFPKRIAVIGIGVIGLELGQALARLGVEVIGIGLGKIIGGLSNPELQDYALKTFRSEFPIDITGVQSLGEDQNQLLIKTGETTYRVDGAFVAVGRRPNVFNLGLENLSIERHEDGQPRSDSGTYRVLGSPKIYLVGDAHGERPVLHEAADEGRIAGYNAVRPSDQCFRRRTRLVITFSDPNIAMVGSSYEELKTSGTSFVTGAVSYEGQGRAIVKLQEKGMVQVYADAEKGTLLGAELFCPQAEHLAHLLAWAIDGQIDVFQALSLPFYHPVLEEGLRTALRNVARQVHKTQAVLEVMRCQDPPVGTFAR